MTVVPLFLIISMRPKRGQIYVENGKKFPNFTWRLILLLSVPLERPPLLKISVVSFVTVSPPLPHHSDLCFFPSVHNSNNTNSKKITVVQRVLK